MAAPAPAPIAPADTRADTGVHLGAETIVERFAARDERAEHPVRTVVTAYLLAWLTLSGTMAVVGVVLVHGILGSGRDRWDQSVSEWLVEQRGPFADSVTRAATLMANTWQVVAIVTVACVVLVLARHWRDALFVVSALVLEVTAFLTANTIVPRERPEVLRMDSTPSTGSFPSGHVAASLALWCALALVVSARVDRRWIARVAWVVAVAITLLVAVARAYRGMHHVTDVVCGVLLGVGALLAASFVTGVVSLVVVRAGERRSGTQ